MIKEEWKNKKKWKNNEKRKEKKREKWELYENNAIRSLTTALSGGLQHSSFIMKEVTNSRIWDSFFLRKNRTHFKMHIHRPVLSISGQNYQRAPSLLVKFCFGNITWWSKLLSPEFAIRMADIRDVTDGIRENDCIY